MRPDLFDLDLRKGDRLLLATDGLHGLMSDEVIRSILARTSNPEHSCDALVEEALARGGVDNVTVALLAVAGNDQAFGSGPVTDPDTIPGPARRGWNFLYLFLIMTAVAGLVWLVAGNVPGGSDERTLSDSLREGGELQRYERLGFDSAAPQLTPGDQAVDSAPRLGPGGDSAGSGSDTTDSITLESPSRVGNPPDGSGVRSQSGRSGSGSSETGER